MRDRKTAISEFCEKHDYSLGGDKGAQHHDRINSRLDKVAALLARLKVGEKINGVVRELRDYGHGLKVKLRIPSEDERKADIYFDVFVSKEHLGENLPYLTVGRLLTGWVLGVEALRQRILLTMIDPSKSQ